MIFLFNRNRFEQLGLCACSAQATRSFTATMRDQGDISGVHTRIRFQPVIELLSFPKGIDFCLECSVRHTMSLDRQLSRQKRSPL